MKQKSISLPAHSHGTPMQLDDNARQILIVGANGAGKTRFAIEMARQAGDKAFCLSALHALFDRDNTGYEFPSIDTIYRRAVEDGGIPYDGGNRSTQLEKLIALLMRDEMTNLLNYKLRLTSDPHAKLHSTPLDTVIGLWQEIFPDNKVLVENGRLQFSRKFDESRSYSALKLSTGERSVIYYIGAINYAPKNALVFIDSPEIFLHPTMMQLLWNRIEQLRPDCTFVYTTHDLDFASSRSDASVIWVRNFDAEKKSWDYEILPPHTAINDEIYMSIIGARKPVLFIEGDGRHSIDSKLYPLIFKDYTVQPLGSCNKVIESTRTFNDLNAFHHLDSYGIVDRDRRDEKEVNYLRGKKVMVPDVAEVENILMLEEVIRTVAQRHGRNDRRVFERVKHAIMTQFSHDLKQQALLHTRHRVKRTMEYRIDGRFANINMLEEHMQALIHEINARGLYESFCKEFRRYVESDDYRSVLRVYNQKSMIPGSNVAGLCGLRTKEEYLDAILTILREDSPESERIRTAVRSCFNLNS